MNPANRSKRTAGPDPYGTETIERLVTGGTRTWLRATSALSAGMTQAVSDSLAAGTQSLTDENIRRVGLDNGLVVGGLRAWACFLENLGRAARDAAAELESGPRAARQTKK